MFKASFPALTGILTLAYFIHNCILSIMRNQENPKNNVSSKEYFEAGGGGRGGGAMVTAGKGCERKKLVSGEGRERK